MRFKKCLCMWVFKLVLISGHSVDKSLQFSWQRFFGIVCCCLTLRAQRKRPAHSVGFIPKVGPEFMFSVSKLMP